MAKSLLRLKARELRKEGESVRIISQKLSIPKSTVSLWVRDVILSVEQLQILTQNSLKGSALGRAKGAFVQKQRRLDKIKRYEDVGIKLLSDLSERELMIAGLSMYWSEGSRRNRRVEFCNSDPRMIEFILIWLQICFGIKVEDLAGYIKIESSHFKRDLVVKEYWCVVTGMRINQFRKTHFKTAQNKKIYENFEEHYGTLSIRVQKSGELYYKIMGLIKGLTFGRVAQSVRA